MADKTEGAAQAEGQADDKAETLIDDLAVVYEAAEKESEDAEPEVEAKADAKEDTQDAEGEEPGGEDGPEAGAEAEADAEADDAEQEDEDDKEVDIPDAPEHWSQADKDRFEELPDDAKSWWLDKTKSLEAGYQEKFSDVAEQRKKFSRYEDLDQFFEPHRQTLQMAGVDEVGYVKQLVTTAQYIRNDPVEGIKYLARSYGVNLADLSGATEATEDEFLDPAAAEKIKDLTGKVTNLESHLADRQRSEEQASDQQLQARIDAFRDAKDDKGTLTHPHFDKVRAQMSGLLQSGAAEDLDKAYEQAVWAQPELRDEQLKAQRAVHDKKTVEKRNAEVKKAKKASRNVKTSSAPTTPSDAPAETWKGELKQVWEAVAES